MGREHVSLLLRVMVWQGLGGEGTGGGGVGGRESGVLCVCIPEGDHGTGGGNAFCNLVQA